MSDIGGKYRKKPVVIEAWQFTRGPQASGLALWCGGTAVRNAKGNGFAFITIPTLEGEMRADYGDWIIKGTEGEFYPCKPAAFAATFEPVEP